jgi:hypothetical protein
MMHMMPRKKSLFLFVLFLSFLVGCKTAGRGLFAERSAREKYEDRIEKTESPQVLAWKRHGEKVLQSPLTIIAPYAEKGVFNADSADANAFLFTVAPGQKITINFQKNPQTYSTAFLELFNAADGTQPTLIEAADTTQYLIEYSATFGGNFILRLQPTLEAKGGYQLNINLGPILSFPIPATVKSNIGSFWGSERDAGARKHEGIDIFAKKGSCRWHREISQRRWYRGQSDLVSSR